MPQPTRQRLAVLARLVWVLPCSLLGGVVGLVVLALGGSAKKVDHTVELALTHHQGAVPRWAAGFPFSGITLGHVIVGQSHEGLAALRSHERVHVRQYERLGVFFFVAYPAASLIAWCQGKCPYLGNYFEQEAFALTPNGRAADSKKIANK